MGRFARSWQITKITFAVIQQDKEMLAFPMLAGVFSLLFTTALLFPTVIVQLLAETGDTSVAFGLVEYICLFVVYLGLAFISTFFNTCVVYTTKVRFSGGDATFMESIRYALSKVGRIFAWSMLAATVGILLRALDQAGRSMGGAGQVVLKIFRSILGMIWSVVVIFVIPVMVYEDVGPFDAVKRSATTLRNTWGESLIRHLGLGFVSGICTFLGIILSIGLVALLSPLGQTGLVVAIALSVTYFLAMFLVFSCANTVFNTALYVYASESQSPTGFAPDVLEGAFRIHHR